MREITATTTQRNQVTIPAEVRRLLGLKPRDKVAFTIGDGGEVHLEPIRQLQQRDMLSRHKQSAA